VFAVAADFYDGILFDGLSGFIGCGRACWFASENYQIIVKLLDVCYLSFTFAATRKWTDPKARIVTAALFAYRLVGVALFFIFRTAPDIILLSECLRGLLFLLAFKAKTLAGMGIVGRSADRFIVLAVGPCEVLPWACSPRKRIHSVGVGLAGHSAGVKPPFHQMTACSSYRNPDSDRYNV